MKIVPLSNGMRGYRVLQAFRYTLRVTHTKRDQILDAVIALDAEGPGADLRTSRPQADPDSRPGDQGQGRRGVRRR
jgi:hypothetical protein